MTRQIVCRDGPHDGRTFGYGEPLPEAVLIPDDRLVYRWERSHRVPN